MIRFQFRDMFYFLPDLNFRESKELKEFFNYTFLSISSLVLLSDSKASCNFSFHFSLSVSKILCNSLFYKGITKGFSEMRREILAFPIKFLISSLSPLLKHARLHVGTHALTLPLFFLSLSLFECINTTFFTFFFNFKDINRFLTR